MTKRQAPGYAQHAATIRDYSRPALAALCNLRPDLAAVFRPTVDDLNAHFYMWPVSRDYFSSVCELFKRYEIGGE